MMSAFTVQGAAQVCELGVAVLGDGDGDGNGGRQRGEDATAGLAGGYFANVVPFHLYLTALDPLQGRMRGS